MPTPGTPVGLVGNSSTTDATSYATASISPTTNRLVLAFIGNSVASGTAGTPTLSGNGLTWVQIATVLNATSIQRTTVFRALGTTSSGAVTIDFAGATQTGCEWSIMELPTPDTSGTNGSGAIVQSNSSTGTGATSPSYSISAPLDSSTVFAAAWRHNFNEGTAPGTSWTEVHDTNHANPNCGFETQYRVNDNVPNASWANSSTWTSVVVEVTGPTATTYNRTLTASTTATAGFVRQVGAIKSATCTGTASFVRQAGRRLSASTTAGSAFVRQVSRTLIASSAPNASFTRNIGRSLTASSAATVSLAASRVRIVVLSASSTATAATTRAVSKTIAATGSASASFSRALGRTLSSTSTGSPTFTRRISRSLTASATGSAQVMAGRALRVTMAAAATATAAIGTTVNRIIVAGRDLALTFGQAMSRWTTGVARGRWFVGAPRGDRWRFGKGRQ